MIRTQKGRFQRGREDEQIQEKCGSHTGEEYSKLLGSAVSTVYLMIKYVNTKY